VKSVVQFRLPSFAAAQPPQVWRNAKPPPFLLPVSAFSFSVLQLFPHPHPRNPCNPWLNSGAWVPIPDPFHRGLRGFRGCRDARLPQCRKGAKVCSPNRSQVSGLRVQVSGLRSQVSGLVPGLKFRASGFSVFLPSCPSSSSLFIRDASASCAKLAKAQRKAFSLPLLSAKSVQSAVKLRSPFSGLRFSSCALCVPCAA